MSWSWVCLISPDAGTLCTAGSGLPLVWPEAAHFCFPDGSVLAICPVCLSSGSVLYCSVLCTFQPHHTCRCPPHKLAPLQRIAFAHVAPLARMPFLPSADWPSLTHPSRPKLDVTSPVMLSAVVPDSLPMLLCSRRTRFTSLLG